jgi:uncharacterized membrane protein
LELAGIVGAWNVLTISCIVGARYNPSSMQLRLPQASGPALLRGGLSLVLPLLAAAGAFRLNNGGNARVAMLALGFAALLIAGALAWRRRLPDGALAWFIFCLGLAVLLMTALRSWDITGHDITQEFQVFRLAQIHGHWDISLFRDPYNACLSITILPQVFSQLLHVSGLVVFKLILQAVFAVCPVVLFALLRKHVSKLAALAGCALFVSYPAFVNDSPMLTRQGVAYLFFALVMLATIGKRVDKQQKVLFLLCATGVILSHYSTSYMLVAIFGIAAVCKIIMLRLHPDKYASRQRQPIVSPFFAAVLFLMTFVWYSQLTGTSRGLITTVIESAVNVPHLFSTDNKSTDSSVALLFAVQKTQTDIYQSYLNDPKLTIDKATPAQYMPTPTDDNVPITPLGRRARSMGFNPAKVAALRQDFAKVLQLLAIAGLLFSVYAWWRGKYLGIVSLDSVSLYAAGVVILVLIVVLPVFSINYGVLRAFQQALIFLLLPMMLLLTQLGRRLQPWLKLRLTVLSAVSIFLLFTGAIGQLLGGVGAGLNLNNRGLYYGLYYATAADSRTFDWLKVHLPKSSDVRAARYSRALMHDPNYPFKNIGILPAQLRPDSYEFLDQAQIERQKLYVYSQGSPLIMTFPLNFYETETNQLYSTGSTGVYH